MPATLTVLGRCGAYPGPGGACRGMLLRGSGGSVLVGCGSGVASRLHWAPASGVPDAVLLPDLREDHTSDLWAMGSLFAAGAAVGGRRGLLPVYAFGEPVVAWRRLHRPGVLDVRRFAAGDVVEVAGWRFTFAPADHPWPSLAVRAESGGAAAGFTGLGAAGPAGAALLHGVGVLVADVGGPARDDDDETLAGGMEPAAAGALGVQARAGRLVLAHLEPGHDPTVALRGAQAAYPLAELALEGRTYDLGA